MITADLLAILCCPETRQPLSPADPALLARVNARLRPDLAQTLRNRGGEPVREPLEIALVRQDGAVLYPVRADLPILLVDEGIFL